MEKLIEIMVNEGIDEDTIVNVISNLMNEEAKEETHSLSESCFNDIISLVEELISEGKVNDFYQSKIDDLNGQIAVEKSKKRHLNSTVDRKANQEYRKAAGQKRAANNIIQDRLQASYKTQDPEKYQENDDDLAQAHVDYQNAENNRQEAIRQYSPQGAALYNNILSLISQKKDYESKQAAHNSHIKKSSTPATKSIGWSNGYRTIKRSRKSSNS